MNVQAENILTEIAPPGSSLHYSLLYCDETSRKKITALRGFYQTIRDIPFKVQNTELAQIKFQWWREELDRLKSKTAQHPITQILQADGIYTDLLHNSLQDILNAFSEDIKTALYEKEVDLEKFYFNTAGSLEKLLYNITDQKILDHLANLGVFTQKVLNLRNLRALLSRGKTYFSGEQLLLHRVNLYELSQLKLTSNIYNLFKNHINNIHAYREHRASKEAPATCPPNLKSYKSTLILTNIHRALLNEIDRADFPILTQSISLTPLRKWWIAFRT